MSIEPGTTDDIGGTPPANPNATELHAAKRHDQPTELRIALAMRGGVSLAVWMGGACSEIVRLRNASPDRPDPYGRLLRLLGYDSVAVDVISGSSAGGLNGAMLALHLGYGMPFGDGLRDLWLRLGDLEQLTRHPAAPHPASVLNGDAETGFYGRLRRACDSLLAAGDVAARTDRDIRLVLTATRLRARGVRVPDSLEAALQAGQARAYFRFQHRTVDGEPVLTDFPDDYVHEVSHRLGYAARTTSSFPGAFEPARIWVAGDEQPPDGRDFRGTSSETGAGDRGGPTAELIDGGVLDNIPVSWAVRAIAGAPADRPVDRWLLYLQPVEPHRGPPRTVPPAERRVTRLVRLVLAALRRRMDSETLLDDAEELLAAETAARQVRGLAAAGLPPDPETVLGDPRRLTEYRRLVGLAEAARLIRLVDDPVTVVGPDPLPIPRHRPEVDSRVLAPLRDPDVAATLAGGEPVPDGVRTPYALARGVALLMDWVRAAESRQQLSRVDAAPLRSRLYSARLAIELLVAARDRILLRALDGATSVDDVIDAVRRATWRLAGTLTPDWRIPTRQTWPTWRDQVRDAADAPLPDAAPDGWPEAAYTPFWDQVTSIGLDISRSLRPDAPGPPGFEALAAAVSADDAAQRMRRLLAAVELLLGPVRTDPFTEPTGITFHTVTASRANPIEPTLYGRSLRPAERNDKLSGNQLSHFAAFLSAPWRQTDWTWGRLDTVPSLVRLLVQPSRLAGRTEEELVAELRELYFSGEDVPADDLASGWQAHRVNAGNVRARFADVVTERLQRAVLAEELPPLVRLLDRGTDRDLPPRRDELADLPAAGPSRAPLIAEVGTEKLHDALHRGHLRRAATRVGLVAWRAIQPAGTGVVARLARAACGLVKPLIVVPALAAVASPVGSVIAALGAWLLVAGAAGTWSNPLTTPLLATGYAVAGGVAAWRLTGARGWPVAVSAAVGAAIPIGGGIVLASLGANQVWDDPVPRYAAILLGALTALAPYGWLRVSRAAGWRLLGLMAVLLVVAGLVGIGLTAVPESLPNAAAVGWLSGPALALLALYAVLAVPTVLLTWLFPEPPNSGDLPAEETQARR